MLSTKVNISSTIGDESSISS